MSGRSALTRAGRTLALGTFEPKELEAERLWSESDTVNALWSLWSDREDVPGPRSSLVGLRTKQNWSRL